ncbi:MAG TPA: type I-C CRISPR-associated protein Cas5c [Bradyrhizobium sp.]|nr:type I-C CRISPR-associated protein Cas5c [Bradyrhizobium sp.]
MQNASTASRPVRLKVWSDRACFTRPEMKVERVSYDVMTPSAARGVLEAILWRPAMRWIVERIDVLKPIRWDSVRRNEVGSKIPTRSVEEAMRRGSGDLGLIIEDDRQQRAGRILRDVAYIVHARLALTGKAATDEPVAKFFEMFLRRASAGQCFHRPYLGCREFAADFALLAPHEVDPKPWPEDRDLGWMLHDYDYAGARPRFFRANLAQGRLKVPPFEAAQAMP